MSGLYVYGVMRGDAPAPSRTGVGDTPVKTVERGSVAALVSEVPGESVPGRAKNLTAHTEVLRAAMDGGTVLPMRFGVLMPDEETVKRDLLATREAWLTGMLDALDGRVEMTVSAMYREEVLLNEVVAHDATIRTLRERVRTRPAAATNFERIRLGELVANAVEARRTADASAILDALRPLADAYVPGDPLHEQMVVNAAFLVRRDRLTEFESRILDVVQEDAEESGQPPAEAEETEPAPSGSDPATTTDDAAEPSGGTSGSAAPTGSSSSATGSAPASGTTAESTAGTESATPTAEATPSG